MDYDEFSDSSSRSVSPPSIRPRDHLQRTAGITTQEYLDDDYEDVSFDAVYNQPLTRTKEDDIYLQYAAATARLPFDMMIDVEMEMFSDYVSDQIHVNTYLYIRNMILNLWNTNPIMELTLENVFEEMPSAYRSLNYLIVKTFAFLERYGYINFGMFSTVEEMLKKNSSEKGGNSTVRSTTSLVSTRTKNNGYKIVVIGAGIAGLAAASQLKFLGFDVLIIEARNRIGGRIFTNETVTKIATDMGPSLIEGINGNPLITLLKQMPALTRPISFKCPLYDDDGQLPPEYCELMAKTFRLLSEAVIVLSKENKVHEINGRPLSIQDTYDHFILLQEANVAVLRREYYATIDNLADTLEKQSKALILTKDIMDTIATRLQEMYDSDPTPIREDFSLIETEAELQRVAAIKSLRYELSEACSIYDRLQIELNDIQHTMSTVRTKEPSEIYLTAMDRRMLDFYFANLELRLGTVLKNVSLSGFANIMTNHFGAKYYEDDDDFDPSAQIDNKLADAMATYGLDQKLKAAATTAETEKKEAEKKTAVTNKNTKSSSTSQQKRDLTQAEIRELQQRGELEMFADLLGVEMEDKKFGDLETKTEFTDYAQKAGNAFVERSDAQFYSDFVYTLIDQVTHPLNKFQLENIVLRLNDRIKQLTEVEAQERAEKEKAAEQKKAQSKGGQQKKKNTIKKEVFEDCLEDDYDDYMDMDNNLIKPLTKQLNIQQGQIVRAIEYDEKQQQVVVKHVKNPRFKGSKEQTRAGEDDELQKVESGYRAHAVVCAVPLGCLKEKKTAQLYVDSRAFTRPHSNSIHHFPTENAK
ncbi:SWIRM domain-containing protein [Aphelenchoides besseyi]|nr:SWIRM domain-containing protein [Aphelenchoides besseyi]